MATYVDKDKAKEHLMNLVFDSLEPEDVAPVIHAHKERKLYDMDRREYFSKQDMPKHEGNLIATIPFCSNCGIKLGQGWNYCAKCGAKMDEKEGIE